MVEGDRGYRAELSLTGLSVGDSFGERFFTHPDQVERLIAERELPPPPWRYTDDTEMALSIVDVLLERGELDQDVLASRFADRYDASRGYGGGAHQLLYSFQQGVDWRVAAPAMFNGTGSFGNGSAMRIAPLGAYLANDLDQVVDQAGESAVVTHAHPEGVAGAVAVAVAAAVAYQQSVEDALDGKVLIQSVLAHTPASTTRDGIAAAASLDPNAPPDEAARRLGSGWDISAQDTVPFVIWCAAHNLTDYRAAFWTTVSGLGDRDTTCAMVGGIVALSSRAIPAEWLSRREPLPSPQERA